MRVNLGSQGSECQELAWVSVTWQHKGLGFPLPIAVHLASCHRHRAVRGQRPSQVSVSVFILFYPGFLMEEQPWVRFEPHRCLMRLHAWAGLYVRGSFGGGLCPYGLHILEDHALVTLYGPAKILSVLWSALQTAEGLPCAGTVLL